MARWPWKELLGAGLVVGAVVGAVAWSGIDPEAWEPGPLDLPEASTALAEAERWPIPGGRGVVGLAEGDDRALYGLTPDGKVWRWGGQERESSPTLVGDFGREVSGLALLPGPRPLARTSHGRLMTLDGVNGEPVSRLESVDRRGLGGAGGLVASAHGEVFLTDGGAAPWEPAGWRTYLEGAPSGRLLWWHKPSGEAEALGVELRQPGGVTPDDERASLYVVEVARRRVVRVWLTEERRGEREILVERLPGVPWGIFSGEDGLWVTLTAPRTPWLDRLARAPWLARLAAWGPRGEGFSGDATSWLIGMEEGGVPVWAAPAPEPGPLTDGVQWGDRVVVGGPSTGHLYVLPLPSEMRFRPASPTRGRR